jgi:hypothetical protein
MAGLDIPVVSLQKGSHIAREIKVRRIAAGDVIRARAIAVAE